VQYLFPFLQPSSGKQKLLLQVGIFDELTFCFAFFLLFAPACPSPLFKRPRSKRSFKQLLQLQGREANANSQLCSWTWWTEQHGLNIMRYYTSNGGSLDFLSQCIQLIPEPRCLNNIRSGVEKNRYKEPTDAYTDLSLVFWNALFYNESDSQIALDAETLKVCFAFTTHYRTS